MASAITCASCKRPLRVPQSILGQLVQCPLCLDEFVAHADPVAEAAARTVEAPIQRAAARPQPVPTPILDQPEVPLEEFEEGPVWFDPAAEVAPSRKPARVSAPGRTLAFPVLVTRDPDRILRGRMDAELTADGLYLRKPRQAPAFAAVGGRTHYLGANRLIVTVEGREVELTVVKPWTSVYHLARDTAGFLGGKGDFPNGRTYDVPWILYVLPSLFVALPFAACPLGLLTDGCGGAFLWCLIAAVLGGAAFAIVLQPRLTPRTRLIGAGSLVGLGALIYLLAFFLTPSYGVDASLWRTYMPADGSFRVKVPGSPTINQNPARAILGDLDGNSVSYTVNVKEPEIRFAVYDFPNLTDDPRFVGKIKDYQVTAATDLLKQEFDMAPEPWIEGEASSSNGLHYYECSYLVKSDFNRRPVEKLWGLAARIYVTSDRTYTLLVIGPKVRAYSPDALKFFDSFQIQQPAIGDPWPVGR
jgi:hypothetical protein